MNIEVKVTVIIPAEDVDLTTKDIVWESEPGELISEVVSQRWPRAEVTYSSELTEEE